MLTVLLETDTTIWTAIYCFFWFDTLDALQLNKKHSNFLFKKEQHH
jgi:hypothetical protein